MIQGMTPTSALNGLSASLSGSALHSGAITILPLQQVQESIRAAIRRSISLHRRHMHPRHIAGSLWRSVFADDPSGMLARSS